MLRGRNVKLALFAFVLTLAVLASAIARAETWQAPVGGKALPLGEGRVACPEGPLDWTVEQDGHAVRPPATEESVGKAFSLKIAASAQACGAPGTTALTLVATGRLPSVDGAGTTLYVDDGRLDLRGRNLRGAIVHWQVAGRSGDDRCVQPQTDPSGVDRCSVAVGRGVPADPAARDLTWLPAGARSDADAVTWDAAGRRVGDDERTIAPGRIVVSSLVPVGVGIDLAGGTASRIPLVHPEAVAGADCGAASCEVSGDVVVVGGVPGVASLPVRMRLAPRVFLQRGDALDGAPVVMVPVLPCAMSIASGDAIRGVDATRAVVRVEARCAGEAHGLRWFGAGRALGVLQTLDADGATYVVLGVGRVEGDELVVTASRGDADASIVGQARARVRTLPPPQASLSLLGGQPVDFLPTNRPAAVRWTRSQGGGDLVLLPLDGVYDVLQAQAGMPTSTTIQGQRGAAGFVSLRFAWRVPTLPGALATTDLAIVTAPVALSMREASVPVALGASAEKTKPIVEVLCGSGPTLTSIAPGSDAHVPFDERDACRIVFHRERLSPEDGAQPLDLDLNVVGVDGTARQEAHVSQTLVLRSGTEPRVAWIKGVVGSFDRVTVRVSHAGDESSTVGSSDLRTGEPSVEYSIVFGTGHFRLYATTAIPTGLFRVSDRDHSGILTLNLGVIMRATWLDGEGHEGFLGLEGGMLAESLTGDQSPSGKSLTQVATVTGVGLSVPIANRSLATETSINLHAWLEYEVSRDFGNGTGSALGFVFGPSISIGNIGTNF